MAVEVEAKLLVVVGILEGEEVSPVVVPGTPYRVHTLHNNLF